MMMTMMMAAAAFCDFSMCGICFWVPLFTVFLRRFGKVCLHDNGAFDMNSGKHDNILIYDVLI